MQFSSPVTDYFTANTSRMYSEHIALIPGLFSHTENKEHPHA